MDEQHSRQNDLDRRITNLETSEKELTESVNRLVVQIEKLATITESMQQAIATIIEKEREIHHLQIDVSNIKGAMKGVIWLIGVFTASGAALIVKYLFGGV